MAKFLNSVLCTVILFLLTFAWIYFCIKDTTLAFALSTIVALASGYIIWRMQSKWETGKNIKKKQKKAVADFCNYLKFGADNAAIFSPMLKYYHFEIIQSNYDNLVAIKNGVKCYVAICFDKDSLAIDDLRKAIVSAKRAECAKLYLFTNRIDSQLKDIANKHISTVCADADNTYKLFEQCEKLPIVPQVKPQKSHFVAKYAFNRRRFGWYFVSSLMMLALSVISYFPWYSLAWATVLFAVAVYSLVNKRYNAVPTRITLD